MVKVEFDVKGQDAIYLIKFAELLAWSKEYSSGEGYLNPKACKRVKMIQDILDAKEA